MTSDGPHAGHEPAEEAAGQPRAGVARARASVPGIRASASVPPAAPQADGSVTSAAPEVPAPRTSVESRPTFSATAPVPAASRLRPGGEPGPAIPDGLPAPRPRVYGTPITPPGGPYPTVPAPRDIEPLFPPIATEHAQAGPARPVARGSAHPTLASGVARVSGAPGVGAPPGGAVPPGATGSPSAPFASPPQAVPGPPAGLLPGRAGVPPQPTQPTGPFRGAGLPAYGDLVGLIPTSAAAAPPAPTTGAPAAPAPPGYPPSPPQLGHPPLGRTPARPAASERPGPAQPTAPPDDQSPFAAFRTAAEQDQTSTPQVRSGRVLVAVIAAAVLLLALPLGIVWLVTRPNPSFNVGECVRQSGTAAVEATCQEPGAYEIVSKVDTVEKCADRNQPYAVLTAKGGTEQVLCLRPAGSG
ncbi:MAG TPA: hypothetical protein VGJ63_11720 [Micromonosporaceae bacterium]|jgi:hypothetical protein